jgi:uncharacterized protein DUF3658
MDGTQAAEIQEHMLDAADAIDQASRLIFALDKEDRAILAAPLGEIVSALHFELLQAVYARYPDLRPVDDDRYIVDTGRRWEDIALPETVSETDLDSAIFSVLKLQWQKTAAIISRAWNRCETLRLPVDIEVLGVRLQALAEAGRLESQGDLRKWRYSEVRLNAEERLDV